MFILINGQSALTAIGTPILILVLIVIVINSKIRSSNSKTEKNFKEFLDAERKANFSRANDIDADFFVKANLDDLPLFDDDYLKANFDEANRYIISKLQDKLIKLGSLKLIRVKEPISNLDLKKQYGVHNFNLFVEFEQNCADYTETLRETAKAYINLNMYDVAEKFLLECKEIGSTSSTTYKLLADIYSTTKQRTKLLSLHKYVETTDIFNNNINTREKILNYVNSLN